MVRGGTPAAERRWRRGRIGWLGLLSILSADAVQAQSLGGIEQRLNSVEETVRQMQGRPPIVPATPPDTGRDRSMATEALVQLDRRLAALERAVSALVAAQEQDHRALSVTVAQIGTVKGDIEERLDTVERRVAALPPNAQKVSAPVPSDVSGAEGIATGGPLAATPSADARFDQAMHYANSQDWPRAELAFDSFVAAWPADPRVAEARFQLARALQGQGKHAQAAKIFLELYEQVPGAPFIVDDLFALAQALADFGPDKVTQACDVYAEIEASHGTALTLEQRSHLLDRRLALKCAG